MSVEGNRPSQKGIEVSPGEGIVGSLANFVVHSPANAQTAPELFGRLDALRDAPWEDVIRSLTEDIVSDGFDTHPALACASINGSKVQVFVFGDIELEVVADSEHYLLKGADSSTWIDLAINGEPQQVASGFASDISVGTLRDGVIAGGGFRWNGLSAMTLTPVWEEASLLKPDNVFQLIHAHEDDDKPAPSILDEAVEHPEDLQEPIHTELPGAELEAEEIEVPAALTVEAQPQPTDEASAEFEAGPQVDQPVDPAGADGVMALVSAPVSAPAEERTEMAAAVEPQAALSPTQDVVSAMFGDRRPTPKPSKGLRGLRCVEGHLTSAADNTCRTCGLGVLDDAGLETAERAVVGHVIFDDDVSLAVTRPAVIGTQLPEGYTIDGQAATAVTLEDPSGGIAPVQLELKVVGWNTEIIDVSETGGAYTRLSEDSNSRTVLRPGHPMVLTSGSTVELGDRSFTFATHKPA